MGGDKKQGEGMAEKEKGMDWKEGREGKGVGKKKM